MANSADPTSEPAEAKAWRSDDPLLRRSDDRLGRTRFADGPAAAIARRHDDASITIGLFGPWGDGKTTVLNFVAEALSDVSDIVIVRFNPWLVSDERELLPAFFKTVADELDTKIGGGRREVAETLRKYGGLLSFAAPLGVGSAASQGTQVLGEAIDHHDGDRRSGPIAAGTRSCRPRTGGASA